MESIVEGLIETKLRRLKEEFHSEIDRLNGEIKRLDGDNKELKADNKMLKENYKRLLNRRGNDATASAPGFYIQNISILANFLNFIEFNKFHFI